ncbi:hypothetical protein V8F20_009704 [Naviculisporaceae sp. PSN 640]
MPSAIFVARSTFLHLLCTRVLVSFLVGIIRTSKNIQDRDYYSTITVAGQRGLLRPVPQTSTVFVCVNSLRGKAIWDRHQHVTRESRETSSHKMRLSGSS